jgi:hypothetical protein
VVWSSLWGIETYYEEAFRARAAGLTVIASALAQRAIGLGVRPDRICHLPGGTAHYTLSLYPPDLPHTATLTATSPLTSLVTTLSSNLIGARAPVTLTVTHSQTGSTLLPGSQYTIPITGTGGGFIRTAYVKTLVCAAEIYLPIVLRGYP